MNLLLLRANELSGDSAVLSGPRARSIIENHDLAAGVTVRAGVSGGKLGRATVVEMTDATLRLRLELSESPPPRRPIVLTVGISRPQTIKKVVQAAVTMGVTELHFVRCELAEKSYLDAQILRPEQLEEEIELGLAQAVDTIAPVVEIHNRFRQFFEEYLPDRIRRLGWRSEKRIVADTGSAQTLSSGFLSPDCQVTIAIGPEAGWSDFELQRLIALGFSGVSLGLRVLRVETAVSAMVAQTALFLESR